MKVEFINRVPEKTDVLVVPVYDGKKTGCVEELAGTRLSDFIKEQIALDPKFEGKRGQTLVLTGAPRGAHTKVVLLGMGKAEDLDRRSVEFLAAPLHNTLEGIGFERAHLVTYPFKGLPVSREELGAVLTNAVHLKSYKYSLKSKPEKAALSNLVAVTGRSKAAEDLYGVLAAETEGVMYARELSNTPSNILYPQSFASSLYDHLEDLGVYVRVYDDRDMAKLGMNAGLAVGGGSVNKPRYVVMQWNGPGNALKNEKPVVFIGKGVTFDSGGISIKPGAAMDEMKFDMGGAAAVSGAMLALAARQAQVRVVGIVGLAENMPDGGSYRPGDVITAMDGTTIEVLNTDAEGRLVLADAFNLLKHLASLKANFNPLVSIDLATLTGAQVVATAHERAGIYTNNADLFNVLATAGYDAHEMLWPMPLDDSYKAAITKSIGDLMNMGGPHGGSVRAAHFVHHFAQGDHAHLDIAGTAWGLEENAIHPTGRVGTGFAVRALNRAATSYERGLPPAIIVPAPRSMPQLLGMM